MSSKILYSLEELDIEVQRVKNMELSYRKAESKYGIPRSTLSDHVTGKSLSLKRGPPTVLTEAEEQMLVDWALHMADIHVGYGRTREQLCATVKEIIDKDGRENPFVDNYPGKFNCSFICVCVYLCSCMSVTRISRRSLKTKSWQMQYRHSATI